MDLLIDTFGTKIGSSGERIVLSFPKSKIKKEYPIRRLDKIVILRPASLTTNAVQLALTHDVDIVYLGSFGKPIGRIFSSEPKGLAGMRRAQLEVSTSYTQSFELAKKIVCAKVCNQISYMTFLRDKYGKNLNKEIVQSTTLRDTLPIYTAENKKSKEQLLGVEGYIADKYFTALKKLCHFPGRKPQGRDPFNSALNYGYGILYNEIERACLYVGLDPYLGIYHGERYGKPALVLDLIEEFRVSLVDAAVFPLFIEKRWNIRKHCTKIAASTYQLSAEGKYLVVEAVMKQLNKKIVWKQKTRAMKDVIRDQAQSLGRSFLKKGEVYTPLVTDLLYE